MNAKYELMHNGKRAFKRVGRQFAAAVYHAGKGYTGFCLNLSRGGLAICLPENFPKLGSFVVILDVGPTEIIAIRVRAVSRAPYLKENKPMVLLGLELATSCPIYQELCTDLEKEELELQLDPDATDFAAAYENRIKPGLRGPSAIEIPDEIKKHIDRFGLTAKLGSGPLGNTFKVRTLGDQDAVLKVFDPQLYNTPELLSAWRDYLEHRASLHHDHLIPILEHGMLSGGKYLYILLPFYASGNLFQQTEQLFRAGNLPHHSHSVRWLRQAASGLNYLHQKGLTHGNLKPGNFLIDDYGNLRLSDPLPPLHLVNPGFLKKAAISWMPQFTKASRISEGKTGSMAPLQLSDDLFSFAGLTEYLLTGTVADHRAARTREPFPQASQNQAFHGFIHTLREGQVKTDILSLLEQAFPTMGNQRKTNHILASPMEIYIKASEQKKYSDFSNDIWERQLALLRETLGFSEDMAQKIEETSEYQKQHSRPKIDKTVSKNLKNMGIRVESRGPRGSHWIVDAIFYPFRNKFVLLTMGTIISCLVIPLISWIGLKIELLASGIRNPSLGVDPFSGILIGGTARLALFFSVFGIIIIISAFTKQIVTEGSSGEDEFNWPSLALFWDDFIIPAFHLYLPIALGFLPLILVSGFYYGYTQFLPDTIDEVGYYFAWAYLGGMVLSSLWLPITYLLVVAYDTIAAISPAPFLRAIPKLIFSYLGLYLFFVLCFVVFLIVSFAFMVILPPMPTLVMILLSMVFLIMTTMRALGLFYFRSQDVFFHYTDL